MKTTKLARPFAAAVLATMLGAPAMAQDADVTLDCTSAHGNDGYSVTLRPEFDKGSVTVTAPDVGIFSGLAAVEDDTLPVNEQHFQLFANKNSGTPLDQSYLVQVDPLAITIVIHRYDTATTRNPNDTITCPVPVMK